MGFADGFLGHCFGGGRDCGAIVKSRRFISCFLAVVILTASTFVPYRESKAVAAPIVFGLVSATGAILASDTLLSLGTAILGMMAVGAVLTIPGDTGQTEVRIPLTNDPVKTASALPVPVTPPVVTPSGSTLPADSNTAVWMALPSGWAHSVGPYTLTDGQVYCQQWTDGCSLSYAGVVQSALGKAPSEFGGCPNGYSVSGSNCNLIAGQERLVTSDKKSDMFVNAQGGLSWHPDLDTAPPNVAVGNGGGKIWGTNSAGQPFLTTITPRVDGGSDITTLTQVASSTGSAIKSDTFAVSAAGVVTGVSGNTLPGSISLSPTATVAPTVTTDATAAPPIVFPDDYARQATAAASLGELAKISKTLTDSSDVPDPLVPPSSSGFTDSFFKDTFDNLLGWQVPSHTSSCPTSSFNAFDRTFTIDAHCNLVNENFNNLRTAMTVIYVLMALFIVLKA